MAKVTYLVPNISCNHCVHTIKMELSEVDGVLSVDANADTKMVTVEFEHPANDGILRQVLEEINYPAQD
jgi:copper chaperone CopZ